MNLKKSENKENVNILFIKKLTFTVNRLTVWVNA